MHYNMGVTILNCASIHTVTLLSQYSGNASLRFPLLLLSDTFRVRIVLFFSLCVLDVYVLNSI